MVNIFWLLVSFRWRWFISGFQEKKERNRPFCAPKSFCNRWAVPVRKLVMNKGSKPWCISSFPSLTYQPSWLDWVVLSNLPYLRRYLGMYIPPTNTKGERSLLDLLISHTSLFHRIIIPVSLEISQPYLSNKIWGTKSVQSKFFLALVITTYGTYHKARHMMVAQCFLCLVTSWEGVKDRRSFVTTCSQTGRTKRLFVHWSNTCKRRCGTLRDDDACFAKNFSRFSPFSLRRARTTPPPTTLNH